VINTCFNHYFPFADSRSRTMTVSKSTIGLLVCVCVCVIALDYVAIYAEKEECNYVVIVKKVKLSL
jgi:hypothetical protein